MSGSPVSWEALTFDAPKRHGTRVTRVTHEPDGKMVIETTPRRASAILQVLAGATLTEVGQSLGVTRERIRQYLRDAGLTVKDRFRPRDNATQAARRATFHRALTQRQRQKAEIRERLRRMATWIERFVGDNGRVPTHGELAEAMAGRPRLQAMPFLLGYLRMTTMQGGRRGSRVLRLAYQWAGVEVRSRGGAGHVHPARWSESRSLAQKDLWARMSPEEKTLRMAHLRAGRNRHIAGDAA